MLITDAATKPSINQGKIRVMLNLPLLVVSAPSDPSEVFLLTSRAKSNVIGTIISVLASLTITAKSPAVSLYAYPAATTDEVSLIAVPAHKPKL
ncbi:hypothetical protein D3C77_655770 [compost metagenome]